MTPDEIWDSLKQKVLKLSGIGSVEPKDCRLLSILISKETKKNISETTLKRIFGFAASPYTASLYTKNVLAQYCGYADWPGYRAGLADKKVVPEPEKGPWGRMRKETNKVNHFMLTAVRNKAVIPLNEMIHREFIQNHLQAFDQSEAMATVIAAPTGYGKTIAISQWLTRRLQDEGTADLYLYLNSSFLLSTLKTALNLNYWMMKMIGLGPSQEFQKIFFDSLKQQGKFYFIIDGFDELMFQKKQFENLLHLLLDVLSIYRSAGWFKVIILMRNSTWLNWRSQLMISPSAWFIGNMDEHGQNLGLLSLSELSSLIRMGRPFTAAEVMQESFANLRYPLFHLYFYKKYHAIIRFEQFNEVLLYELISDYMIQNIMHGNEALPKMDFIFQLITLMEYRAGIYTVNKEKIKLQRSGQLKTYTTLVQMGFLWEIESTSALYKTVSIQFNHVHILGCCIAVYVLRKDADFSLAKLEYVAKHWSKDSKLKLIILKWCLFQAALAGKKEEWIAAYQQYLEPAELDDLARFIRNLAAASYTSKPGSIDY